MQSHYRKNLVFSWENLDNARVAYDKLIARIATLDGKDGELDGQAFDQARSAFVNALSNDLNTAQAVTALYDVFKLNTNGKTKLALIADFDRVLCLDLIKKSEEKKQSENKTEQSGGVSEELLAYINEMIEARKAAKKDKNFAEADRIRDELLSRGITLVDTREGTKFTLNQ